MNRAELLEHLPEDVRELMEQSLFDMKQSNDIQADIERALNKLREERFFSESENNPKSKVKPIEGLVNHWSEKFGKYIWEDVHYVGEINKTWIIDISCQPGGRIFYNESDYYNRSGIKFK